MMSFSVIALWALVGFCGNEPHPLPPFTAPVPPRPWPWLVSKVIAIGAGILGGWAYTQVFLPQDPVPYYPAATAVGAFAASGFATGPAETSSNRLLPMLVMRQARVDSWVGN